MNGRLPKLFTVLIFLSIYSLIINISTIPYIGTAPPEPWWTLKIFPPQYWIGLFIVIISYIIILTYKKQGLLFFPLLLSVFISVPRLMFSNPIWTDNYGFVSEVFYILKTGYIGSICHAKETPGLSLFVSQLSLITGKEYLITAMFFPFILYLFSVIAIYMVAIEFCDEPFSSMASFLFISFNWIGFHFNRESFGLLTYIILLSFFFRSLMKGYSTAEKIASLILYIANIISHPGTSATLLLIAITQLLVIAKYRSEDRTLNRLIARSLFVLLLIVLWLFWYTYRYETITRAIYETIKTLNEIIGNVSSLPLGKFNMETKYSDKYNFIVMLKKFSVLFIEILGLLSSISICLIFKAEFRYLYLSFSYLATIPLLFYSYYSTWSALFYRHYLYTLPLVSILVILFIFKFKPNATILRFFSHLFKIVLIVFLIFFMLINPLLVYSIAPFSYPPSSEVITDKFIALYAESYNNLVWGLEPESPAFFMLMVYQAKINSVGYHYVPEIAPDGWLVYENNRFNSMATTFRVFAKDAFEKYTPPLLERLKVLENKLVNEYQYNIVFNTGSINKIYIMGKI